MATYHLEEEGVSSVLNKAKAGFDEDNIYASMAFSSDGRWLALLSYMEFDDVDSLNITLFDVEDLAVEWVTRLNGETVGSKPWEFEHDEIPTEILFRGDSEILYGAQYGHLISLDRATGEIIRNLTIPPSAIPGFTDTEPVDDEYGPRDLMSITLDPAGDKVWAALRSGHSFGFTLEPIPSLMLPVPALALPRLRPNKRVYRTESWILVAALSPDGARCLLGTDDDNLQMIDCHTGETIFNLSLPRALLHGAAYSQDGRSIALDMTLLSHPSAPPGSYARQIRIWDEQSGAERQTLDCGMIPSLMTPKPAIGLVMAPNGKQIVSFGFDGRASLWDAETGRLLADLGLAFGAVGFSSDGTQLVTVSSNAQIVFWETSSGRRLKAIGAPADQYMHLQVNFLERDTQVLLIEETQDQVRRWDLETGRCLDVVRLPKGTMGDVVACSPDGRLLVVGAREPVVWDLTTRQPRFILRGHGNTLEAIFFSADGNSLATIETDCLRIWDVRRFPESPPA